MRSLKKRVWLRLCLMFVLSLILTSLVNFGITLFAGCVDLENQARSYLEQIVGHSATPEDITKAFQEKFSFFVWSKRTTILLIISQGFSWFMLGLLAPEVLNQQAMLLILFYPFVVNLILFNRHSVMYTSPLLFSITLCVFAALVFLGERLGVKKKNQGLV